MAHTEKGEIAILDWYKTIDKDSPVESHRAVNLISIHLISLFFCSPIFYKTFT